MMDARQLQTEYQRLLGAFRRQLPDPGLRLTVGQGADEYFRQCALSVWKVGGTPVTPAHADWYNALGAEPPVLYWELVTRTDEAGPIPEPPFWQRLKDYDKRTGHSTARRFLTPLSLVLVLLAGADGQVSPREAAAIQTCLDALAAQCDQENLPGDRTPISIAQYITQTPAPSAPQPVKPSDRQPQPDPEPQTEEKEPTLEELLAQLDELCGLEKVKADVHSLINLVKVRKLREEAGLPVPPMSLHLVFQGNPGTGKTTVARLLARLYKAIGVLSRGQLVEVDRSGLVAGYVGQTALKTSEVVQSALGGVLFIDEAYALAPQDNPNDFGREAIEVLLKAMEDHRKDLIVIVAGYTDLMGNFIHSNPGLESRFNKYLTFEDYDGAQLLEIFHSLCRKNGYTLAPAAEELARETFQRLYETRDKNFGNAREVRNRFETAIARQADRLAGAENPTKEDLMELTAEDWGEE